MEVYLVMGGCWGDQHVIAVYQDEKAAEARARAASFPPSISASFPALLLIRSVNRYI